MRLSDQRCAEIVADATRVVVEWQSKGKTREEAWSALLSTVLAWQTSSPDAFEFLRSYARIVTDGKVGR